MHAVCAEQRAKEKPRRQKSGRNPAQRVRVQLLKDGGPPGPRAPRACARLPAPPGGRSAQSGVAGSAASTRSGQLDRRAHRLRDLPPRQRGMRGCQAHLRLKTFYFYFRRGAGPGSTVDSPAHRENTRFTTCHSQRVPAACPGFSLTHLRAAKPGGGDGAQDTVRRFPERSGTAAVAGCVPMLADQPARSTLDQRGTPNACQGPKKSQPRQPPEACLWTSQDGCRYKKRAKTPQSQRKMCIRPCLTGTGTAGASPHVALQTSGGPRARNPTRGPQPLPLQAHGHQGGLRPSTNVA